MYLYSEFAKTYSIEIIFYKKALVDINDTNITMKLAIHRSQHRPRFIKVEHVLCALRCVSDSTRVAHKASQTCPYHNLITYFTNGRRWVVP